MKHIITTAFFALFIFTVTLVACKPDPSFEPYVAAPFEFKVPQGWPAPFYKYDSNALSREGFELGKKMFYDTRFSRDNTISCGSCHQQFAGFAQADHDVSHGINDLLGNRNSPALFNLNWHTSFFWDGGVNHIESQPINPINNPVEMDESIQNVIAKLKADAKYPGMFKAAFGDELINSQRIFRAFAQFMGMLISSNAKFDKYKRGEEGGTMTAQELSGYQVYQSKCSSCHKEPLFTDFSLRNNGLSVTAVNDSGRAHITKNATDLYKFKIPSLRNLKYTGPYMHDGRIKTLDAVLDHYANGIVASATLDTILTGGIQLSTTERQDLLAFLNTLNDEAFVKNKEFAEVK